MDVLIQRKLMEQPVQDTVVMFCIFESSQITYLDFVDYSFTLRGKIHLTIP